MSKARNKIGTPSQITKFRVPHKAEATCDWAQLQALSVPLAVRKANRAGFHL
ncbi:hypothetical protein [Paenibacillus brevis]|uniref:hypothetical protein n=1 Tax=Paenibacillus brevis TaxID=2841508 RepID=UPI001C127F16|nr:hypothetical protein [Paenibacillus brevis]